MSIDVVWCDAFVRLDPKTGEVLDGDGQQPLPPPVRMTAARNGFACFQLRVGPIRKGQAVAVSGGALKGPGRARLSARQYDVFVEWYRRCGDTWYPEVCVPQRIVGASTEALRKQNGVRGQQHVGFWIDLFVPPDARPGEYAGSVTVQVDDERCRVPVELTVTRARLPENPCLDVSLNNYATAISRGWQELRDDPNRLTSAKNLRCERGVFRTAHDHRMFLHYLPYGHSGYVPPTFAPPLEGEGPKKRVASWKEWDAHWGPYFDGTAFRGTRRGPVPVRRFYLPLNLCWPADFVKFGQPGYAAEWRAVGRQMVEHFREKGWTRTRFDLFLNHKQRFRFFPWDTEEARFLEDNEIHRYFRALWEGTFDRRSAHPVTFDYTLGTTWTYSRDIRSDFVEFIDVFIAGTAFIAWDADRLPALHRAGRQVWSCANSGSVPVSPRAPFFVPLQMWMLSADGFMPCWCTLGGFGPDQLHDEGPGGTTFFYSGAGLDSEETFASLRMKVQRQALQMVDQLQLAADAARGGKRAVRNKVNRALGLVSGWWGMKKPPYVEKKLPKDWVDADFATEEPPVAGWEKLSTEQFRALDALAAGLAAGGK